MVFDYLKNKVSATLSDVNQALIGDRNQQIERLEKDIQGLESQFDRRQAILTVKIQQRRDFLDQEHKVEGHSAEHYPDLDPINFTEAGEESLLATIAQQIIERFPGSQGLLSQLDQSLHAFCESRDFRLIIL